MLSALEKENLKKLAQETRINIIKMVHSAKSGHPGGSLSGVDILTVLYHKCLNIPEKWNEAADYEQRDRFILSKGHASPLLYAVLAQKGLINKSDLISFRKFSSLLQGHPAKQYIKGVETSTGSLGQGISIGCGIALGLKLDKNSANVIVYTGDGELQEGSCWEGIMQATHRSLNNLIVIVDRNRLQIDGNTENVMALENLCDKFKAFNWDTIEINGHDFDEIYDAVEKAKLSDKPCAIIANTIKGKGVSFMENQAGWHGKAPNDDQFEIAMQDLGV